MRLFVIIKKEYARSKIFMTHISGTVKKSFHFNYFGNDSKKLINPSLDATLKRVIQELRNHVCIYFFFHGRHKQAKHASSRGLSRVPFYVYSCFFGIDDIIMVEEIVK